MKKAVIAVTGHQYVVSEGDQFEVNLMDTEAEATFVPLMVIDGDAVSIGAPEVTGAQVVCEVVTADFKGDKVTAIRYKPKKRVNKIRGHRQRLTTLKVTKITTK